MGNPRSLRVFSNGLVILATAVGAALSIGCYVDRQAIKTCSAPATSLGMSTQSQLGVSGDELKELATGDYTVMATGSDGESFALQLRVSSSADRAEQRFGQNEPPSLACPSTLRIQGHFQMTGGELVGSWDGDIIASKVTSAAGNISTRGEATVARASFTMLPSAAAAPRFSFGTTLGATAINVEPGGPGEVHSTESPLYLAIW